MICTGTGSTPQNCVSDVPGAGQVNWNQVQTVYSGNIYPGSTDAAAVFKCALDKQCTIQQRTRTLRPPTLPAGPWDSSKQINSNLSIQADYVGNHGTKLVGMQYTNTRPWELGIAATPTVVRSRRPRSRRWPL